MSEDPGRLQELAGMPRRSAACLSDLELDQLVAARAPSVRQQAHVEDCERCRARLATFQAGAAEGGLLVERLVARARERAPAPRPAPARARPRRRLVLAAASCAVALSGAGALGLMAIDGGSGPEPAGEPEARSLGPGQVRAKGAAVRLYVRRDGRVRRARSGDLFRAGDQLRFVVRAPSPAGPPPAEDRAYFLMLGIEPSGAVSAYYPFGGERSMRIDAGTEVQLPNSLVLDDAPGPELLLSVFSDEPIDAGEVAARVRERGAPVELERLLDLELPGQAHWTVLRKGEGRR